MSRSSLSAKDIEAGMEGRWQKLRMEKRTGTMPRVANYITGPSRTADVEATMVLAPIWSPPSASGAGG